MKKERKPLINDTLDFIIVLFFIVIGLCVLILILSLLTGYIARGGNAGNAEMLLVGKVLTKL